MFALHFKTSNRKPNLLNDSPTARWVQTRGSPVKSTRFDGLGCFSARQPLRNGSCQGCLWTLFRGKTQILLPSTPVAENLLFAQATRITVLPFSRRVSPLSKMTFRDLPKGQPLGLWSGNLIVCTWDGSQKAIPANPHELCSSGRPLCFCSGRTISSDCDSIDLAECAECHKWLGVSHPYCFLM